MSLNEVTGKARSGAIIEPRMVAANTVSSTGSEVKSYVPVMAATELKNIEIMMCDMVIKCSLTFDSMAALQMFDPGMLRDRGQGQ